MKLSTLLDRIEQAVDGADGDVGRTKKYIARLRAAAEYEGTMSLDVKATMSRTAKKAVAEAPKVLPVSSSEKGDDAKSAQM